MNIVILKMKYTTEISVIFQVPIICQGQGKSCSSYTLNGRSSDRDIDSEDIRGRVVGFFGL